MLSNWHPTYRIVVRGLDSSGYLVHVHNSHPELVASWNKEIVSVEPAQVDVCYTQAHTWTQYLQETRSERHLWDVPGNRLRCK